MNDAGNEADLAHASHRADALFEAVDRHPPVLPARPVTTRRRWPRARRVLMVLAVLLLVVVALGFGAFSWLGSEDGHQWIARQLEVNISSQIRGHLVIGHLDAIDLDHVVGTDVRFIDEGGRPVIVVDHVDMQYEASELLSGHFVSYSAQARGGQLMIETDRHGVLLVNRAFQSAHMGPPGQPIGPDVVHLENLDVSDVTVTTALGAAPVATLRGVSALVLVRAPDHGAAFVEAHHVSGALNVAAPIPFDLRVMAASLVVDGAAHRRAHIDLPSRMGSERIGIEITALTLPGNNLHVDARIRPHGLMAMLAATSMIAQCLLAETATDALDVTVELQ